MFMDTTVLALQHWSKKIHLMWVCARTDLTNNMLVYFRLNLVTTLLEADHMRLYTQAVIFTTHVLEKKDLTKTW